MLLETSPARPHLSPPVCLSIGLLLLFSIFRFYSLSSSFAFFLLLLFFVTPLLCLGNTPPPHIIRVSSSFIHPTRRGGSPSFTRSLFLGEGEEASLVSRLMTAGVLFSPPASTSLFAEFSSSSVFSARRHTANRDATLTRENPHDAE